MVLLTAEMKGYWGFCLRDSPRLAESISTPQNEMKAKSIMCLLGLVIIGLLMPALRAEEKRAGEPEMGDFLRFSEDDEAGRLETAIATYRNEAGAEVYLVGAVHIGDAEYYEELNRDFAGYEALLFEMIGGGDDLEKEDLEGTGTVRRLQGMMGKTLELEFQLDGIDYTADNFVHADMDAETFAERFKAQGLNLFALMNKVSKWERERAIERREKGLPATDMGLTELVKALLFGGGKDLKLSLGRQFGDLNGFLAELEDEGSVIIGERNAVALDVLAKTLKDGKRKVGIFYGAAHLPDMEARLAEMGFARTGVDWRTAWFIPKKAGAARDRGEGVEGEVERDRDPAADTSAEEVPGGAKGGEPRETKAAAE